MQSRMILIVIALYMMFPHIGLDPENIADFLDLIIVKNIPFRKIIIEESADLLSDHTPVIINM